MPHLITENRPFTVRVGWTVAEFERLFDAGFFAPDARLELIDGEVWEKMSQNEPHIRAILLAQYKFLQIYGNSRLVCIQIPLILGDTSKPEPDISIVQGTPRDPDALPATTAELVIEISDSTLRADSDHQSRALCALKSPNTGS